MLTVDYTTAADVSGCFNFKNSNFVESWLAARSDPGGYRLSIANKKGDQVGAKAFGVSEITWLEGSNANEVKPRTILGCRATTVTLDNKTIERARQIGVGNISLGIRLAVAAMQGLEGEATDAKSSMSKELAERLDKMPRGNSMFEMQLPRGESHKVFIAEAKSEALKRGFDVRVEEIRAIKNRFIIGRE